MTRVIKKHCHTVTKQLCLLLISGMLQIRGHSQINEAGSYSLTNGVLPPRIQCLIQSPEGYLLAGTSDGLFAFDGARFTRFVTDSSMGTMAVTALGYAGGKNIWVGFQNGALGLLNNQAVSPCIFEEGKFNKAVTVIVTDAKNRVWCGTAGEGVYCYDGRKWTNFSTDDGMQDNYIYDLLVHDQKIIVATDGGVHSIDFVNGSKKIQAITTTDGLADNIITSLIKPPGYPIIASHQAGGLSWVRFNEKNELITLQRTTDWSFGEISSLAFVNGRLYAGTLESGLVTASLSGNDGLATQGFEKLQVFMPSVQNTLADAQGNLWVSTANQLKRINHPQWSVLCSLSAEDAQAVHTSIADKAGNIWFNLHNEVWMQPKYPAGSKAVRKAVLQTPRNTEITSMYADESGHLWIGTMGYGVWMLNTYANRLKQITEDSLLLNGSILSIAGKGDQIWIISLAGAVYCSINATQDNAGWPKLQFKDYSHISGLGTNYVYNVFTDSKNRVWFATDGKGLMLFENNTFTTYDKKHGLASNVIYKIAEDRKGRIWINALNEGLYYYDGKTFTQFTVNDGLTSNDIASLTATADGDIAAVSSKAIDIINVSNLVVQTWDQSSGIENINTDLHGSSTHPEGGILFISGKGICRLTPAAPAKAPVVFIESVELFLSNVDWNTQNEFSADENNLGIHFNATEFLHPDKLRFQYTLEGLSQEWITTRDRYINFPKLPPGKYIFKVKASLTSSFHSSSEAVFTFSIAKPIWQRTWFIFLTGLLIAGSVWAIIRYREKQLQHLQLMQQENLQSQLETLKSQVSPHFFFNSLNTVVALIDEDPAMAVEYTTQLSDFFRKVVQYRDVNTISLKEELDLINTYFFIQQKRFGKALRLNNQVLASIEKKYLVAPLTIQMLVENAIKHNAITENSPLEVCLQIKGDLLLVSNNIAPKLEKEPGAGMGLQNIQRRYRLLTGKDVTIDHDAGHFVVGIPLILNYH